MTAGDAVGGDRDVLQPGERFMDPPNEDVIIPNPAGRTVTELPPSRYGVWGPETVFMGGVEYGRLHGGTWVAGRRHCDYAWGDWVCDKPAHGPDEGHRLTFIDCDGDVTVDPRLT